MICWKIVYKARIWGKLSLIYRENSHIFSLHSYLYLLLLSVEKIGQQKISAVLPTLEEGLLQINKQVFTYLSLGGVNVILL